MSILGAIPFYRIPPIEIPLPFFDGDLPLRPFGMLVATGVLVGAYVARKRAETLKVDEDDLRSLVGWVLVCGFVGAHVFDVLAYQMDELKEDPLLLIKVWAGISSYGGFIGGLAGILIYTKKIAKVPIVPFADIIGWGLLVGFTFGRMGCSAVHDHLGKKAGDFFLAMDVPCSAELKYNFPSVPATPACLKEGSGEHIIGRFHELGLYELLYLALFVIPVLFLLTRKIKTVGFNVAFITITYGAARFFLDYLRVNETDPRYIGFTFAQWMSVATVAAGVGVAVYLVKRGRHEKEWAEEMAALGPLHERRGQGSSGGKGAGATKKAGGPAKKTGAVAKKGGGSAKKGSGKGQSKKKSKSKGGRK